MSWGPALAQSEEFYIHSSIVLLRLIHKSQVKPSLLRGGSVTKYSRTGVSVALPHRVKKKMRAFRKTGKKWGSPYLFDD
jgi:hypothetical protein